MQQRQEEVRMQIDTGLFRDAALGGLTGLCALTDLYCGRIYNPVTVSGLCLGMLMAVQRAGASGILEVLCASGFTVLVLFPFYTAGGLGAGDIKLLAAVAAFLPAQAYLRCFAGAFVIGAAYGAACLLLTHGQKRTLHFAVPVAVSVLLHLAGFY